MTQSNMESPIGTPGWKLIDSPERPMCVPPDGNVTVYATPEGVRYVRTPDERFCGLEDYPFAPHYATVDGLRMHYVDEGSADSEVVLMLHGQPSWSYLYRKMIPPIVAAGYRVIAVDHIGMGRSDKPIDLDFHTYEKHVARLKRFIAALDLRNITLFCQDWGGLIGLRVVGDEPDRFARVVAANTTLPVLPKGMNPFKVPTPVTINCDVGTFEPPLHASADVDAAAYTRGFQRWILYALTAPDFRPSEVVEKLTINTLPSAAADGYNAPYPSMIYKAAVRAFPSMIAAVQDENVPAWESLGGFTRPFLFLAGDADRNLGSEQNQARLTSHIPGAAGQPHERFHAGHFIQEDIGEMLADRVIRFMRANQLPAGSADTCAASTVSGGTPNTSNQLPSGYKGRDNLHGARYGEVLVIEGLPTRLTATVYNSIGLNDLPEAQWRALDANKLKHDLHAHAVLLNGPRYFLMDTNALEHPGELVTFGELQFRRLASVRLPFGTLMGGMRRKPYTEQIVERTTIYTYRKGREIYELHAPGGKVYVMQTYAQIVDPSLTEADLPTLGPRLHLPEGWRYETRTLTEEYVLRSTKEARVIQDDLQNTYQLVGSMQNTERAH